jgi:hypothetical protein
LTDMDVDFMIFTYFPESGGFMVFFLEDTYFSW